MALWLNPTVYGHCPASFQFGSFPVCGLVCEFPCLDAAVAAPGRTVGPVPKPASRKQGFRRRLFGDDAVKPSGFRPVAQGVDGNGFTRVRTAEGLFIEGKEEAG